MRTRGREIDRPMPPKRRPPPRERSRNPKCNLAWAVASMGMRLLTNPGDEEIEGLPLHRAARLVDQRPEPQDLLKDLVAPEQMHARGDDRRLDDRVLAAVEPQKVAGPALM